MRKQKKWKITRKFLLVGIMIAGFLFLNNTSIFTKSPDSEPLLLAHRGLGQTFPMEGIEADTCTAEWIFEPEHPYLENTIPSMKAAFEAGADIVELDIQMTKDQQFAVFHDASLDCRTEAAGAIKDYTMEELKQLDIGYGYTADGGKTYPFRGKGIGLMPSLDEVLRDIPEGEFLLHIKSNDPEEGALLAEFLRRLPAEQRSRLSVYGGDMPVYTLKNELPTVRAMSKETLKSCLISYEGAGWTGYVPAVCRNTQLHIPEKYARLLWGWPDKFLSRMEKVNTRVILVGGDGEWSEGYDTLEDLERLPDGYTGGIWTNRIDVIGPSYKIAD
ncbi:MULTISPECIES: glycerophosphodiester phosphodiesterase family protein [Paenibacillus]|nr:MULTISPECIES: glycerophosphodiester phosphodiesterase family protein [Paenibacillus]